jgi:hypothetical protein
MENTCLSTHITLSTRDPWPNGVSLQMTNEGCPTLYLLHYYVCFISSNCEGESVRLLTDNLEAGTSIQLPTKQNKF